MREKEQEEHRKAQEDIDRQIKEEEDERRKADEIRQKEEDEKLKKEKEEEVERKRKGREERLKKREELRGDGFQDETIFDEPDNILEEVKTSEEVTTITTTTTQVTTTTTVMTTPTPQGDGLESEELDLEEDINPKQVNLRRRTLFCCMVSVVQVSNKQHSGWIDILRLIDR